MKKYLIGFAVIVVGGLFFLFSNQNSVSAPQSQAIGKNPSVTYKDGTYTGSVTDAYYGNVQVRATIQGGNIIDVTFLQFPNTHGTSIAINGQAMLYLKQEAIQSQSANVNIVSGATDTSMAFQQSLTTALSQAQG